MSGSSRTGRVVALLALLAAVLVVGYVLLNGGSSYTVHARFQNAAQLVKGNLVQVSGVGIGKVSNIDLSPNGEADVTLKIDDTSYTPLRRGTRAIVRQASLSGVANRYVDLQLPPGDDSNSAKIDNGGVIGEDSTTTAVDLDQLFNTFDPKTRKSLSGLIQGFAKQSDGASKNINAGFAYLSPSLAASSRLFNELTYDKPALTKFLVDSSQLTGDLAQRKDDLAGLVDHLATTTQAIGREDNRLQDAIQELPPFMRRANTTFVNLRATLDDVDPLVAESKPVAKKLRPFLAELRPLARDARPTLRDLSAIIQSPGGDNDLIELTKSNVPLRNVAVGPIQRDGKERLGALPASTKALETARPRWRPHAPTRPTSPAGSTTSATRASTTRSAAPAASRPTSTRSRTSTASSGPIDANLPLVGQTPLQKQAASQSMTTDQRGAARARSSAARRSSPRPTSPCDVPGAARAMRRALVTLAVLAGGVAVFFALGARRTHRPARRTTRVRRCLRPDHGGDLKIAGVRAGKVTELKLDRKTNRAIVGFHDHKSGFGSLRTDAFCEFASAVADRRVLRRLPARAAPEALKPGAAIPVKQTGVDGPPT